MIVIVIVITSRLDSTPLTQSRHSSIENTAHPNLTALDTRGSIL